MNGDKRGAAAAWFALDHLPELDQLDLIGRAAMAGKVVAVIVDDHIKADRYVHALGRRFPGVEVLSRHPDTPILGVVTLKIGPKPAGRAA